MKLFSLAFLILLVIDEYNCAPFDFWDEYCDDMMIYYYHWPERRRSSCIFGRHRYNRYYTRCQWYSDYDMYDYLFDIPEDNPVVKLTDKLLDQPTDKPLDQPTEKRLDQPTDQPTDNPLDQLTDKPLHQPADKPLDQDTDKPLDQPTDKPLDQLTDKPSDQPSDKPIDQSMDKPLEQSSTDSEESFLENLSHYRTVNPFFDTPTEIIFNFDVSTVNPFENVTDV